MKFLVSLASANDKNKDVNVSHALLRALLHGTCMPAPLNTMYKLLLSEPASYLLALSRLFWMLYSLNTSAFQCLDPMDTLFPKPFPMQLFVQPDVYCGCYTMFQAALNEAPPLF